MGNCSQPGIAAEASSLSGRAFFRDATVSLRVLCVLRGEYGADTKFFPGAFAAGKAMITTKVLTHLMEECVIEGSAEISDTDEGRVTPSTSRATGDDGNLPFDALSEEKAFWTYGINRIDYSAEWAFKNAFEGLVGKKVAFCVQVAFRINHAKPLCHDLDLRLTNGLRESVDLPISVGDADIVKVHKGDFTESGPRESLCAPRAYSSNSDDGNVCLAEGICAQVSVESTYAGESFLVGITHRRYGQ